MSTEQTEQKSALIIYLDHFVTWNTAVEDFLFDYSITFGIMDSM